MIASGRGELAKRRKQYLLGGTMQVEGRFASMDGAPEQAWDKGVESLRRLSVGCLLELIPDRRCAHRRDPHDAELPGPARNGEQGVAEHGAQYSLPDFSRVSV